MCGSQMFLSVFFESLVLVTALSIDAFVACFGYGTNRIRIPLGSAAVIDGISGGILVLFLLVGKLISPILPQGILKVFCFAVLFGLGIVKLFDSSLKALIRKSGQTAPQLYFSILKFQFILTVYADPDKADADESSLLSPREAVSLGAALSLDSAAVGFGAGVLPLHVGLTAALSLLVGALAIWLGCLLGNKVAERSSLNLSWLSGLLLIVLALMKFV